MFIFSSVVLYMDNDYHNDVYRNFTAKIVVVCKRPRESVISAPHTQYLK